MRCIYTVRGYIVGQSFLRSLAWWELIVWRCCDWIIDKKEMWDMRHDFRRLEAMEAEQERIAEDLQRIRKEFGLDEPKEPKR